MVITPPTTAWTPAKVRAFRSAFMNFLNHVKIDSKETGGGTVLGDHIYGAQERFLDCVFEGLSEDIHDFKILKSRQLGITTVSRALTLFWLGMHPGLKGSMVFDTNDHRDEARNEFITMLDDLPDSLGFPKKLKDGRGLLTLTNNSTFTFLSAGVRKSKASGTLGRSSGLNFVHASEMCLAQGTPVLINDGTSVAIENVNVGDVVLTHTGARARVLAVHGLTNTKRMITIDPWLGEKINCTEDHKICTARGKIEAKDLQLDDLLVLPVRKITNEVKSIRLPETPARQQNGGSVSAGSGATLKINKELGFFVGYYLAEGSITYQRRGELYRTKPSGVIFTRHRSEKAYADRAIAAVKKVITSNRRTVDKKNSFTTTEHLYSSCLATWLVSVFGASKDKRIPDAVFTWGESFNQGLIAGLLCGDGSKTPSKAGKYNIDRVNLTSIRSSFVFQVRDLVASLGLGWGSVSSRKAGNYSGRNCKASWTISWCGVAGSNLRRLMGLSVQTMHARSWVQKYILKKNRVLIKISSVKEGAPCGTVYDLTVKHRDHTFRTPSMSVSNCSWENEEGVTSFRNSLSENFANRLYIWESTARGFNQWYRMWQEAKNDNLNQKTCFIGWWAKESQMIAQGTPAFVKYGSTPPTPEEMLKIQEVEQRYGHKVTAEQLAWYRRKVRPAMDDEDDEEKTTVEELMQQEQPWTEEEAFLQTGSTFFSNEKLTLITKNDVSNKYQSYYFSQGAEFIDSDWHAAHRKRDVQLKVWEEPDPDAQYIVAADPAFGHSEENNHSACQVLKCYADCLEQVAEYANSSIQTQPFAWVIASLAGWYKNCHMILEINGPGEAVWNEYKGLKPLVLSGHLKSRAKEKGLHDIFNNVKDYMYARSDSTAGNSGTMHWKTTVQLKVAIMERLRDFTSNGTLKIRSLETVDEMKTVIRNGDTIGSEGRNRDDRTFCFAMAIRGWENGLRRVMSVQGKTREAEVAKKRMTVKDQIVLFNKNKLDNFFSQKQRQRKSALADMRRKNWRGR